MVSTRYILILGLVLSLIVPVITIPVFAIEDLTNETYITPAYKIQLEGDYKYSRDGINWYWDYPNFDIPNTVLNGNFINGTLGTYPIYNRADNIEFGICLESGFTGTLYLVLYYQDENGNLQTDEYLAKEIKYSSECVEKTVQIPNTYYGNIYYRWEFSSVGIRKNSDTYSLFLSKNLNSNWKYRKPIAVTTTEKWNKGTIRIKLNSSDFYNHTKTKYDEDGNEEGFSGTLTDIVITDEQQTKVYPYFIDTYKGGFYNYSRESSNDTYIITYLNENVTQGNLYIYYGYDSKYSYPYIFGKKDNGFLDTDFLNNPFGIYQIYSDYRWTENFFDNEVLQNITNPYNEGDYIRATEYQVDNYICNVNFYFYKNNLTEWDMTDYYGSNAKITIYAYNTSHTIFEVQTNGYATVSYRHLFNSSGNYTTVTTPNFRIEDNYLIAGANNISEMNYNYFDITTLKIDLLDSGYMAKLKYFYSLPFISASYTTGNETQTEYAIIQFLDMYEYDSFINDLWIGGIFSTDRKGTFYCFDVNGTILGSIEITKDSLNTYNIILPYTLTNKTDFLNRSDFNYTCSFIPTTGGFTPKSENATINFITNRIFLDTIKPYSQYNYSSEYVAYNINSELNYTGIQTNFSLTTNKIKCLEISDGKCIKYDYMNEFNSYNNLNISTSYNYNNVYEMDVNNWYHQYYKFCRDGICLSTPSRIFYVHKEEPLISFPVDDYIDWNDTDLTNNTEFMNNMFWADPLAWFSSFIYQNFIITQITDKRVLEIFRYVFLIFWSYLFILLIIWMAFLYQFREHYESVKIASIGTMPFFILFAYLGWLGIDIVALMILLISIGVLYLWKR